MQKHVDLKVVGCKDISGADGVWTPPAAGGADWSTDKAEDCVLDVDGALWVRAANDKAGVPEKARQDDRQAVADGQAYSNPPLEQSLVGTTYRISLEVRSLSAAGDLTTACSYMLQSGC